MTDPTNEDIIAMNMARLSAKNPKLIPNGSHTSAKMGWPPRAGLSMHAEQANEVNTNISDNIFRNFSDALDASGSKKAPTTGANIASSTSVPISQLPISIHFMQKKYIPVTIELQLIFHVCCPLSCKYCYKVIRHENLLIDKIIYLFYYLTNIPQ